MSNTKKSFALSGSILGIVMSAFMILFAIMLLTYAEMIDIELITTLLKDAGEDVSLITDKELETVASITRAIIYTISLYVAVMSVAQLVMSIVVLKKANKGTLNKGLVIGLLVISLFNGGILTTAFMIVVLCLKDKPKAIEGDIETTTNY